jgi:hypothetical protein
VAPMIFLIRRMVRYFKSRKQGAQNPQDPQGS